MWVFYCFFKHNCASVYSLALYRQVLLFIWVVHSGSPRTGVSVLSITGTSMYRWRMTYGVIQMAQRMETFDEKISKKSLLKQQEIQDYELRSSSNYS